MTTTTATRHRRVPEARGTVSFLPKFALQGRSSPESARLGDERLTREVAADVIDAPGLVRPGAEADAAQRLELVLIPARARQTAGEK